MLFFFFFLIVTEKIFKRCVDVTQTCLNGVLGSAKLRVRLGNVKGSFPI